MRIFGSLDESIQEDLLKNENFVLHVRNYYVTKRAELLEDDRISFEFVATTKLLSKGCPPVIKAISKITPRLKMFFIDAWSQMEGFDEGSFLTFLLDYEKTPFQRYMLQMSTESFKFIASSPVLIKKIVEMKLEFTFVKETDDIFEILELPNLSSYKPFLNTIHFYPFLTYLNTDSEFEKFEEFTGISVADHFLRMQYVNRSELNEDDYFEWRPVITYWIKGAEKEKINEITSPTIIRLLKLDFPIDMRQILTS